MDRFQAVKDALSEQYPIERELGRGGMATVYLALDRKHGRKVAVKVMDRTLSETVGSERFLREIRTVAGLQHPHILPLHDSGEVDGLLYYVMPYIEGGTLADRFEREGPLPAEDAVRIAIEIGDALAHAHDQGFVHRDVKPANILMSGQHALLSDFGIVRMPAVAGDEGLTIQGVTVGTPSYMSPEQASGEESVGPRSDIYSLGCVLYEALAGTPPHTGPTPQAILARSLTESPRPISSLRHVDPRLEAVLSRALERAPADRYPTARDFADDLRTLSGTGELAQAPRRRARAPWIRWAAAAGIVAAVGALSWFLSGRAGGGAAGSGTGAAFDQVAVLPFGFIGGDDLSHLGEGVASLLGTVMDGVQDLRTVDPAAVMGVVAQEGSDVASPERAREVVGKLGAHRYVSGSIQELGGRISVTAALHDLNKTPTELERWTVEGDPDADLFRMINALSVDILGGLGVEGTPEDLESVTTRSPVALNAFLKGEASLGHGDYVSATEALRRSVEVDSLFALGWYRLAYAQMFTEGSSGAVQPAQRAWALSDRLPVRDRRLTEALLAMVMADADEASRLYRDVLQDHPNDVEALFGLADIRLHFGPLHGYPMGSLGVEFDRVLYLDHDHSEALLHRPWVAGLEGDTAGVATGVHALVDLDPSGYFAPIFQTMLAVSESDSTLLASATAGLADDLARLLAVTMTSTLRNLEATEALAARAFDAPGILPETQAFGHMVRAHQLVGLGRWQDAMAQLGEAASLDPAAALEDRALIMLAPFAPVTRAELEGLRAEVQSWDADNVPPSRSGNPWIVPHEGLHGALRLYLLGRLNARLDDVATALSYADSLSGDEEGSASAAIRRTLARDVRAGAAFADRRTEDGLRELEQPGLRGPDARTWERAYSSPFFSESLERFERAQALAATGQTQKAQDFLASIWMSNALDLAYLAPAHLARAEIYEQAGDHTAALQHYRRFVELWANADPELMSRVDSAQERIRALEETNSPE